MAENEPPLNGITIHDTAPENAKDNVYPPMSHCERLAAAEQQAKDLLTAQVDLLAEVADLTAKNSEKDLTLAGLTKRVEQLEAKAAKLADMVG
jgi:hypothetical protein